MNLIRIALTLAFAAIGSHIQAQRYGCENGKVVFFSSAPVENIQATNQMVSSIFVPENGTLVFSVPVKEFQFEKKLMQEHFNDKYMESDRFPRSTFAGALSGYDMSLTGIQQVRAKGALTIHGIRKDVDVPGTLQVNGNTLVMKATFTVRMADFNIKIPAVLWKNISEEVEITLDLTYKR